MFQFIVITVSFLNALVATSAELVVRDYGIQHIDRRDVGMVFYVEVKNDGKQSLSLNGRMVKCCETIHSDDIDCEHMQLIGGDMGLLAPRGLRNVTLIWPTLLLHNRLGECVIGISFTCKNNQTGEIHQKVRFDSTVSTHHIPPILEGYYDPYNVDSCSTVDLDALDGCRPVNCHVKYSGKRNFFNRKVQRCQVVPICIADTSKELPDVAYVPASNTCRDLENAVNEVEVRALSRGAAETAWRSEALPYIANMHCHHGYADNATGFCICHEGWTSHSIDNVEPSTEYIHMCNIQKRPWPRLYAARLKVVLIVIAALLGILAVLFCCAMAYVMREFLPPGNMSDCAQQAGGSSCRESSRTLTSCCSSRLTRRSEKESSGLSCPAQR